VRVRTLFGFTPTALAMEWHERNLYEYEAYRKLQEHMGEVETAMASRRFIVRAPTLLRGFAADGGLLCEWVTELGEQSEAA
jgi:hypothetical protein